MEFIGRIKKLLPVRSGKSERTGNEWKVQPFIFEYFEEDNRRYADEVKLESFDETQIRLIVEGATVRVGFGHRTREINGNVYNDIRLYKIEPVVTQQQQSSQPQAGAFPPSQPAGLFEQHNGDLPY